MSLIHSLSLALLLFGCLSSAFAAQSPFPDIQQLLDAGKLRVALLAQDAPPVIMTDNSGAPTGIEVEHALDIGAKLGLPVEFIRTAATYDEVVDVVARKEADIAVSFLSSGVRRAIQVLFSKPYAKQEHHIFYNRAAFAQLRSKLPLSRIQDIAKTNLAGDLSIGALKGSIHAKTMRQEQPQFSLRLYQTLPELVTAVRAGEIFAGRHGEVQLGFYLRQRPEMAIYVAVEPAGRFDDIRIAVRPDAPNLLRWINLYLDQHVGLLDADAIMRRSRPTLVTAD